MGWMSLLLLFSAPEKRRDWGVGVSPTKRLAELSIVIEQTIDLPIAKQRVAGSKAKSCWQ